jgi:hypothetical protein
MFKLVTAVLKTHAIILCAGDGKRWGNFLGSPKHLIKIDGERLIDRTVRLIKTLSNDETDIFIVANNDPRYEINGCKLFIPEKNPQIGEADAYINSKQLWNKEGRTIIFFGDVWFSEFCMKSIVQNMDKDWTTFGRKGGSVITGHPYGEPFAYSFYPDQIHMLEDILNKIIKEFQKKTIEIGFWRSYLSMIRVNPNLKHVYRNRFFQIDDFTDDFDFPRDYKYWIKNWERFKNNKKSITRLKILEFYLTSVLPRYVPTSKTKNKILSKLTNIRIA